MQRVRVGLTGLACVFLLVFLAAAFFGLARPDPVPADAGNTQSTTPDGNTAEPREPLAELGVTPGNLPGTADADAPPAAPATDPAPAAGPSPAAPAAPTR